MKTEKMYNMILPIWLLVFVPITWIVVIPINFVVDSAVLIMMMQLLKVKNKVDIYKRVIIKVWIYGFLADLIGGIIIPLGAFVIFADRYSSITEALTMNPFDNAVALLWTLLSILIAGVFIYIFNKKNILKRIDMGDKEKKIISIGMAIITAPYIMLIPTKLFSSFYQ